MISRIHRLSARLAPLALAAGLVTPLAAQISDYEEAPAPDPTKITGRLVAAPGSEVELKAAISGVIADFPVAAGQLAAKDTLIVAYDMRALEAKLEKARRQLTQAQAEKRRLATEGRPTSSQPTAQTAEALRAAQRALQFEDAEKGAMQDFLDVQNDIAKSRIEAPSNGYVVRPLVTTGGKIKRKTPLVLFVPAEKVRLEAAVAAEIASTFAVGDAVTIVAESGGKPVAGKVASIGAQPNADGTVAMVFESKEKLPFGLGEPLTITPAPAG